MFGSPYKEGAAPPTSTLFGVGQHRKEPRGPHEEPARPQMEKTNRRNKENGRNNIFSAVPCRVWFWKFQEKARICVADTVTGRRPRSHPADGTSKILIRIFEESFFYIRQTAPVISTTPLHPHLSFEESGLLAWGPPRGGWISDILEFEEIPKAVRAGLPKPSR